MYLFMTVRLLTDTALTLPSTPIDDDLVSSGAPSVCRKYSPPPRAGVSVEGSLTLLIVSIFPLCR
jgi:hypothetical protein